jgi:dipeptidase
MVRKPMILQVILSLTLVVAVVACLALPAYACSSIIVGKNASKTGEVLLGHNEDNGGRLVMPQYIMPRRQHEPGTMIRCEDFAALIPQVEETWSFIWTETRTLSGASFSCGFINEWGVAVMSDNCGPSNEDNPDLLDGGIGYGLRRIIAERARTAREGVEIAAELVGTYGYLASGRSYQIVDKNEGWMFQAVNGKHYVAQRVGDDEIAFIPNRYTIRKVDLEDTENFIASPDLITYAIERGWYTPAVPDDYSDFDFAKAYQKGYTPNDIRQRRAYSMILGREIGEDEEIPFAVKAQRKFGPEDVMEILRTHYEGTADDLTNGYEVSPHFVANRRICTSTTQESAVVQFRENPIFTVYWRTSGRPCVNPYVPWYLGILSVPDGYGWLDPIVAMDTHFSAHPDDVSYNASRAWWAFMDLQNIADPQYGEVVDEIQKHVFALEKEFFNKQSEIEATAYALYAQDPQKAREFLTEYTHEVAKKAWDLAVELYEKFATVDMHILAHEISKSSPEGMLSVAILSTENFDAREIDLLSVTLGPAYQNPSRWAPAVQGALQDVNRDGKADMVVKFKVEDVAGYATVCYLDLWLSGKTLDGNVFVAKDLINIVE